MSSICFFVLLSFHNVVNKAYSCEKNRVNSKHYKDVQSITNQAHIIDYGFEFVNRWRVDIRYRKPKIADAESL